MRSLLSGVALLLREDQMANSAVVDSKTNIVVNTIVADAATDLPPDGTYLVDIPEGMYCNIGCYWNGTEFVPPAENEFAPSAEEV